MRRLEDRFRLPTYLVALLCACVSLGAAHDAAAKEPAQHDASAQEPAAPQPASSAPFELRSGTWDLHDMPAVAECGARSGCAADGGCLCDVLGRIMVERFYGPGDVDCGSAREVIRRYDDDGRVAAALTRSPVVCARPEQLLTEYQTACSPSDAPCLNGPAERFVSLPSEGPGCLCSNARCVGCVSPGVPTRTGFVATVEHLYGTWLFDMEATLASAPEEAQDVPASVLESMSITMEFRRDATVSMAIGGVSYADDAPRIAQFSVESVMGDSLRVLATFASPDEPGEPEGANIVFFNEDVLSLSDDNNDDPIFFRRAP